MYCGQSGYFLNKSRVYIYIYIYIYISFITMQYHYFLHTSEHKNAFFPFWHEFQDYIPVKIGVLQSQTFTNNNDHCCFIVETATIQALLQRPKRMLVRRITVTSVRTFPIERIQFFVWCTKGSYLATDVKVSWSKLHQAVVAVCRSRRLLWLLCPDTRIQRAQLFHSRIQMS